MAGFVQSYTPVGSTSSVTSLSLVVPAGGTPVGNTVIVRFANYQGTAAPSLSDSKGNTWTRDLAYNTTSMGCNDIWSSIITTALVAGDTITVSTAAANQDYILAADEFSGLNGLERVSTITSGDSLTPSSTLGAQTDTCFLYGFVQLSNSTTMTWTDDSDTAGGDSWHVLPWATSKAFGSQAESVYAAYKIPTSNVSQTFNPSYSGSVHSWVCAVAAYRISTGPPAVFGTANLNLSASGEITPGVVGTAHLNLDTSHTIQNILTGEAHLRLDAHGETPRPAVDNTPNQEHLRTLALSEQPEPQYRLCIAETLTGQVLADLPYAANPSWKTELDQPGSLSSITVPLYDQSGNKLPDDVLSYLNDDYRYTIVWAYGGKILQMGLLAGLTVDDSQSPPVASITTITIWEWFNKMRIVKTPGLSLTDPASNLSFSATATDEANRNLSWGSVARRLVENDMSTYSSNAFPIDIGLPSSGTATIDYAASDGKPVGQALSDIAALDNGPELIFDPVWTDQAETYVRWNFYTVDGRLGQLGFDHVWDYQQACQSLVITRDPSQMTFQQYEKGADNRSEGSTGTLSWSKSDIVPDKTGQGWPNIITFGTSHSSETKNDVLYSYANATVRTNQNPVFTATATVRMNGKTVNGYQTGSPSLDQVRVGDTAYIWVQNHPFWPDGKYGVRITAIGSGSDLWTAALTLQILGATTL